MKLLITGGAGYIGSHTARHALEKGHQVTIIDNFSTGHKWAVKDYETLNIDLLDQEALSNALRGRQFDGVVHFAAKSLVSESIQNPSIYFKNNILGTLNLLDEMIKHDIKNIVFSSTAAVYGNPKSEKISENHTKIPINPYGKSKLYTENILQDYSSAHGLKVISLRYFNAAGADRSGEIGEAHEPETHLIPSILKNIINEKNSLNVYGNDYKTHDGTCIRDYIHVCDIAKAHILGLKKIHKLSNFTAMNLGNSRGFSIFEIIDSVERVTGQKVKYNLAPRREGDPAILVADNSMARATLDWQPEYTELDKIIETAYIWHQKFK